MKVPKIFIPENKDLNKKLENLLSEEGIKPNEQSLYNPDLRKKLVPRIKSYLEYLAKAKKNGAKRILYISDSCEISQYEDVKDIILSEIDKSYFNKYSDSILDYYKKLSNKDMINLLDKCLTESPSIFVVYTSEAVDKNITGGNPFFNITPFFEKAYVINI